MVRFRMFKGIALSCALLFGLCAEAQITTQRIRFYVQAELLQGTTQAEAGANLQKYVADLNTVFSKQTVRRFTFNPATDLIVGPMPNPSNSDIIDVQLLKSTYAPGGVLYSNGGNATVYDWYLGGQVYNLALDKIYDPLNLPTDFEKDMYLNRQLRTLIHEFEHIFAAGMGEYYSLAVAYDTTGVSPIQNLELNAGYPAVTDPYWSTHLDYMSDPLLTAQYMNPRLGNPSTREATLAATSFARSTVAVINKAWNPKYYADSNYLAERNYARVRPVNSVTGLPVPNATVKVWVVPLDGRQSFAPPVLVGDGATDASGQFTFAWNIGFSWALASNYDNKILVKTFANGYESKAVWYSIYDHLEKKLVDFQNEIIVRVPMVSLAPPTVAVSSSGTNVSINPSAVQNIAVGAKASFTVTANSGYTRSNTVGGTCPAGTWSGNVYQTGVISAACAVSFSAAGNPISIYTSQVPSSANLSDGVAYELGLKFRSTVAGKITAIKYYKPSMETAGGHTGRIWSATGTQLASAVFANETSSGWQTVTLSTPLNVTANTTYVVSVNVKSRYSVTVNGLTSAINNGFLSALAGPDNGVYGNSGSFPSVSGQSTSVFRDVVFVPGP